MFPNYDVLFKMICVAQLINTLHIFPFTGHLVHSIFDVITHRNFLALLAIFAGGSALIIELTKDHIFDGPPNLYLLAAILFFGLFVQSLFCSVVGNIRINQSKQKGWIKHIDRIILFRNNDLDEYNFSILLLIIDIVPLAILDFSFQMMK